MATPTLFSIIESSGHPNTSEFYRSIGVEETKINSMRKAIAAIKKQQPDFIVAEFFYGYGNNYAGVNVCKLDVFLYSLQKYSPDAKIIVMLRSPAKVAESLYHQFCYGHEEDAATFEEAWNLQECRLNGERIPVGIYESSRLQYRNVCSLGSQLERLVSLVPKEQLKIILFDDFVKDTKKVYSEVLAFLGLSDNGRDNFPVMNKRKAHRLNSLSKFVRSNKSVNRIVRHIKGAFGINRIGLSTYLLRLNQKDIKKVESDKAFQIKLEKEFESEVALIEELLHVDLDCWRN